MQTYLTSLALTLASCCSFVTGSATAADASSRRVDPAFLSREHINITGKLVYGAQVHDRQGQHLLVLSRLVGQSPDQSNPDPNDHVDIRAAYYTRASDKWAQDWVIYDFVDCPHLDFNAAFLPNTTRVTDVDGDGVDEITVAYKLLCRGGMDFDTVKVIMRQGDMKFAIRGEVQIGLPSGESTNGEPVPDKALLLPQNAVYKKHLESAWRAAMASYNE
jgi:hypothetical protein